ncbi:MAG: AI-2E family transporter, partial [Rhodococcus sp.]|nr:AI-2E family transporter [Rhodococcus sp. (in: high G+C Gram-positive bacteria)]
MSNDDTAAAAKGRVRAPRWLRPTIIGVLLAVAFYQMSGWLFHNLKGFLGLLFLAWLFSVTIEPIVDALARRGWRRGAAT